MLGTVGGTTPPTRTTTAVPTLLPDPRVPRPADRGFSLVEVVITIALVGILVVPVLEAVATVTRISSAARETVAVETALVNAVDRVNRAPVGQCDYTSYARAAVLTQGWSADQVTVDHAYLDDGVWSSGPAGAAGCPDGGARNLMVQLVEITITSPDGRITREVQVVKSGV